MVEPSLASQTWAERGKPALVKLSRSDATNVAPAGKLSLLPNSPVIGCQYPLPQRKLLAKRLLDFGVAFFMGLILAPILIIVAVLIKCDSEGPVIFVQTRNGLNNRCFRIYKFRTLRTMEDGPIIKQVTTDDPRLTRLGSLLRRYSIDELPQLWNVLKGEMSLVGPRPHAVAHNTQYSAMIVDYDARHSVKPGLTGWAQVNGLRGETRTLGAMQQRVAYDHWYIRNWSVWLDCKIMFQTIFVVFQNLAAVKPHRCHEV